MATAASGTGLWCVVQNGNYLRVRDALRRACGECVGDVFPPHCTLCQAPLIDAVVCPEHELPRAPLGPRCARCEGALPPMLPDGGRCAACRRRALGLWRVVALGDYGDPALREWILAFKHGGRKDLAEPLGAALAARFRSLWGTGGRGSVRPAYPAWLAPVPLHSLRRAQRGYDQAALLASNVAAASGIPQATVLRRRRFTPPQGGPGSVSRSANVSAAFALRRRARGLLEEAEVWLVDDVMTTGSTAAECARVLRRGGARRVGLLVLARAASISAVGSRS